MIIVWDNGEDYSDHRIEFVAIGDHDPRVIGPAMVGIRGGIVLASAPSFEWWEGGAETLAAFLGWRATDGQNKHHWRAIPASVRSDVIASMLRAAEEARKNHPTYTGFIDAQERAAAFLKSLDEVTP